MKKSKDYILITLGAALVALGIQLFFIPNKIAPGGVTGISLVLTTFTPGISVSAYVILLNIILFALAFKFLGEGFGKKTIYAAASLSAFMWIIENVFKPVPLTDDLMLNSVMGIFLLGTGLGIVFNQQASTGGTDIIAQLLHKYTSLSVGISMTIIDLTVVILVALFFGLERGLYAAMATMLNGLVINKVVGGFNEKKQVFIITKHKEEVRSFIVHDLYRGATIFEGEGAYGGNKNHVLYTVLNTKEFVRLKLFLKENYQDSFVTASTTTEVIGQGFSLPQKKLDHQVEKKERYHEREDKRD